MSDYYQKCVEQIKQFLKDGEYQKAREMITTELAMPYVPLEFERQLQSLAQMLPSSQNYVQPYFNDFDDLVEALKVGGELQEKAIASLAKRNIREDIEDLKELLLSDIDKVVKQSILYIMMEQDISDEIEIAMDSCQYVLVPSSLESPLEAEGVLEAKAWIEEHYAHNDPSFVLLCNQMIDLMVIEIFPQSYDQGEGELLAHEVVEIILKSLGREQEINPFYRIDSLEETKKSRH